ncbi:MAG: cell division protein ZapA [Candidatus Aminicenantes bacterium]|jgi:cell division protein ZapA
MIDKIIEIEIYGQKYKIRVKGEEDEKYISHLTSHVDQKMQEVAVKSKSLDMFKIAVLAALNIADEYFLCQKKLDQLNEVIGHMEEELESLEAYIHRDGTTYKTIQQESKKVEEFGSK